MKGKFWAAAAVLALVALGGGVAIAETATTDSSSDPAPPDPQLDSFDFFDPLSGADMTPANDQIQAWAEAIAQHESGGNPTARNWRNNNPGNLKYAGQPGATGHDAQGFAVFGTLQDGWNALYRQLQKYVRDFPDFSILNIMARYLGNSDPLNPQVTAEGNPFTYARSVADAVGVTPDATLSETFA